MGIKKSYWIGLCLLLLSIFLWRAPQYFSAQGGYRTNSGDILNHYYVTEAIRHGDIFPDWNKAEIAEHAVSNRLPVYHGLILAHSLASLLVAAGVPLPGSLQMVSDIAFAISLFILLLFLPSVGGWHRWTLGLLTVFLIGYMYLIQLYGASYSQTVGITLGLFIFWLLKNNKAPRMSFILLFVSAFAYPDAILVLAPLIASDLWQKKMRVELATVFLLWVGCLWIFIRRFSLQGPLNIDFSASYILILMLLGHKFLFANRNSINEEKKLFIGYTSVLIGLIAVSLLTQHHLNYYLNKFTAWSYPVFALTLYLISDWKKRVLVVFVFAICFGSGLGEEGEQKLTVTRFFQKDESLLLSNQSWRELDELFNQPKFPLTKQITPWFSEADTKEFGLSIPAIVAIGRGYNLTSGVSHSKIFASYNQDRPLPVFRLNEMAKVIGDLGEPGRINILEQLPRFSGEVLVMPRKYWTSFQAKNLQTIQTENLIAIWRD